jgi:hypothetical protein
MQLKSCKVYKENKEEVRSTRHRARPNQTHVPSPALTNRGNGGCCLTRPVEPPRRPCDYSCQWHSKPQELAGRTSTTGYICLSRPYRNGPCGTGVTFTFNVSRRPTSSTASSIPPQHIIHIHSCYFWLIGSKRLLYLAFQVADRFPISPVYCKCLLYVPVRERKLSLQRCPVGVPAFSKCGGCRPLSQNF